MYLLSILSFQDDYKMRGDPASLTQLLFKDKASLEQGLLDWMVEIMTDVLERYAHNQPQYRYAKRVLNKDYTIKNKYVGKLGAIAKVFESTIEGEYISRQYSYTMYEIDEVDATLKKIKLPSCDDNVSSDDDSESESDEEEEDEDECHDDEDDA